MILKDGIYEAEGLFSTDGGFTIKVEGGEMKFFEGVGPANRLKLAVMDPFRVSCNQIKSSARRRVLRSSGASSTKAW